MPSSLSLPAEPASTVLLTGATGFIGKVVLERLLATNSEARVYVLVRPKRGIPADARLCTLLSSPAFAALPLHERRRVTAIEGDLTLPNAGIVDETAAILSAQLTHIINVAGAIEFDLPLAEAAKTNIAGPLHLLHFARRCPRLRAFVHTSTAYVAPPDASDGEVAERLPCLPLNAEEVWEEMQRGASDVLFASWLTSTGLPNSYAFSKCLCELLLTAKRETVPLIIVRPSIVCASVRHPVPGWIDSKAAIAAFIFLVGGGFMHTVEADEQNPVDIVPCDAVASVVLDAAFHPNLNRTAAPILHAVAERKHSIRISQLVDGTLGFFGQRGRWAYFRPYIRVIAKSGDPRLAPSVATDVQLLKRKLLFATVLGNRAAAGNLKRLIAAVQRVHKVMGHFGHTPYRFVASRPLARYAGRFDEQAYVGLLVHGVQHFLLGGRGLPPSELLQYRRSSVASVSASLEPSEITLLEGSSVVFSKRQRLSTLTRISVFSQLEMPMEEELFGEIRTTAEPEQDEDRRRRSTASHSAPPHPPPAAQPMCTAEAELSNWAGNAKTAPTRFVVVESVAQLQQVVADTDAYPSPLRPVGARLSPSGVVRNDCGSVVSTERLRTIHGLVQLAGQGGELVPCVHAEAGVTLSQLQRYLHKRQLELPFSPEVGDATLGGLCFCTTQDSAIGARTPSGGLGDFQSSLLSLTLVDRDGELREHRLFDAKGNRSSAFQQLLGSYGTRGIAASLGLAVRAATPLTTSIHVIRYSSQRAGAAAALAVRIRDMHARAEAVDGNVKAVIGVSSGMVLVEERIPRLPGLGGGDNAPMSSTVKKVYQPLKKTYLSTGRLPSVLAALRPLSGSSLLRYNEGQRHKGFKLAKAASSQAARRQTSASYFFDLSRFAEVLIAGLEWADTYKQRHGFSPDAYSVSFVRRSGVQEAGPFALQGDGVSFSFDPVYHSPLDPAWADFVRASNVWALELGGRPALNLTLHIEEQLGWGASCVCGTPDARFTSSWLGSFFAPEPEKIAPRPWASHEEKKSGSRTPDEVGSSTGHGSTRSDP